MASTASGTDDASLSAGEEDYQPPCREAARYVVPCPYCGRKVQLRTLKYTHRCGRTFDPMQRALEQQKSAVAALKSRLARGK